MTRLVLEGDLSLAVATRRHRGRLALVGLVLGCWCPDPATSGERRLQDSGAFADYLKAASEDRLDETRPGETLRIIYAPSFGDTVIVRLDKRRNNWSVRTKILCAGLGFAEGQVIEVLEVDPSPPKVPPTPRPRCIAGELLSNETRTPTDSEGVGLESAVANQFWRGTDPVTTQRTAEMGGRTFAQHDGTLWAVEGVREGRYRSMHLYEPRDQAICELLRRVFRVAGVELEDDDCRAAR